MSRTTCTSGAGPGTRMSRSIFDELTERFDITSPWVYKRIRWRGWRMTRTTICTATIACVLFLPVSRVGHAQDVTKDKDACSGQWKPLVDGVCVVRVARPANLEPEFAILRLTDATYRTFQNVRKEFVNKNQVFSKPVIDLPPCIMSPANHQTSGDPDWYVVMSHWPPSNARCVVFPGAAPSD